VSFGKKIDAAVRALKAEGKLPPGLRAVERDKLVIDKLQELGHDTRRGPSRWTLARHLDPARTNCTFCTSTSDTAGVICAPDNLEPDEGTTRCKGYGLSCAR